MSRILFASLRLPRAKASLLKACLASLGSEVSLAEVKSIVASVYGYSTWAELKHASGTCAGRSTDLSELDHARTLNVLGRTTGLVGPRLLQLSQAVAFGDSRSRLLRSADQVRITSVGSTSGHDPAEMNRPSLDDLGRHLPGWDDLTAAMSGLIVVCDRDGATRRFVSDQVAGQIAIGRDSVRTNDFLEEVFPFEPAPTFNVPTHGLPLDYMRALKRFMRSDPCLLRIAITDRESARTAMKAVGLGHLLLATMDASDVDECVSVLTGHGDGTDPACRHVRVIHDISTVGGKDGRPLDIVALRLTEWRGPADGAVQSVVGAESGTVGTTMGPPKASTAGSTSSISA